MARSTRKLRTALDTIAGRLGLAPGASTEVVLEALDDRLCRLEKLEYALARPVRDQARAARIPGEVFREDVGDLAMAYGEAARERAVYDLQRPRGGQRLVRIERRAQQMRSAFEAKYGPAEAER